MLQGVHAIICYTLIDREVDCDLISDQFDLDRILSNSLALDAVVLRVIPVGVADRLARSRAYEHVHLIWCNPMMVDIFVEAYLRRRARLINLSYL